MNITQLKPYAQQLIKLGAKRRKRPLQELFGPPVAQPQSPLRPIKPDVDYHPEAERTPQAPNFAGMWIDHYSNIGNTQNPLASPLESH